MTALAPLKVRVCIYVCVCLRRGAFFSLFLSLSVSLSFSLFLFNSHRACHAPDPSDSCARLGRDASLQKHNNCIISISIK